MSPKQQVTAFFSQARRSSPVASPMGSESSVNSFLERTEKTIKEGQLVIKQGNGLLGQGAGNDEEMGGENAHKKRSHDDTDRSGGEVVAYKMSFAPANDPIHVLPRIPVLFCAKLQELQVEQERHQALCDHLSAETNRLPAELQSLVVRQPTLKEKFDLLVDLLNKHGMQLGS